MSNTPADTPPPNRLRQIASVFIALVIGGFLVFGAYLYWVYHREHPTTDDGSIGANYVWVSPRIDGQVIEVAVVDNQVVKRGDPLVRLDPTAYAAKLTEATSAAKLVRQDILVQQATVDAAAAKVREQQALTDDAKQQAERIAELVKRGDEPALKGIELEDEFKAAQATLEDMKAELVVAQRQLGPPDIQQARIDKAEAAVVAAQAELDWTELTAPADGWVARVMLRDGDVVQSADDLFVLVEAGEWWVQANFKETDIAGIEPGMNARVRIDSYPHRTFTATVESIGPASAASFSLLPAQNTTGNWVKVTQRIPVRVRLADLDRAAPYRIGMSATVTVDLESGKSASSSADSAGTTGAAGDSGSSASSD